MIRIIAPGRICFFGEHQDYLGLPVIAAAINLHIGLEAVPKEEPGFKLEMPDIGESLEINPALEQEYAHHRDYIRSSVNILRREGLSWPQGYKVVIKGAIPMSAGVSSSSALVIMWLRFLLETAVPGPSFSPEDLARWGYQAEVTEFGDPGGMMDHYCSALGGVLWIDTRPPFAAEQWDLPLEGIVLGDSLQPKATLETLARTRADVTLGVELLKKEFPTFQLESTPIQEALPYLERLPLNPARRLRANLVNRDVTMRAREAILSGDQVRLGELLSAHHAQLRDGLDLSTPRIERMLEASTAAGALGGKINGSGGGGCMFAYAPGCEESAAEAIRREGGIPYIMNVDGGVRVLNG